MPRFARRPFLTRLMSIAAEDAGDVARPPKRGGPLVGSCPAGTSLTRPSCPNVQDWPHRMCETRHGKLYRTSPPFSPRVTSEVGPNIEQCGHRDAKAMGPKSLSGGSNASSTRFPRSLFSWARAGRCKSWRAGALAQQGSRRERRGGRRSTRQARHGNSDLPRPAAAVRKHHSSIGRCGRFCVHGRSRSNVAATFSRKASAPGRPTSCSASGKPSRSKPHGSDTAGWPVRLNTDV